MTFHPNLWQDEVVENEADVEIEIQVQVQVQVENDIYDDNEEIEKNGTWREERKFCVGQSKGKEIASGRTEK